LIFFFAVHEVVYFLIARGLVGLRMAWSWPHELLSGIANAVLGVLVFMACWTGSSNERKQVLLR